MDLRETIAKLLAEADDLERRAVAAMDADDVQGAAVLYTRAEARREVARLLRGSTGVNRRATVHPMQVDHRVAISKGRSDDALAVAARKAGYTLRSLAKKVGVSVALLSMARKGDRSIKRDVAMKIEALTGFSSWRGGIVD